MLKIKILNKPKPFKLKCNISFPNITESNLQEKEVTPTTNIQEVVADSEFDGLSKVIVDAVTNEIDENIQPSNIKLGVSILGVEGNVEPDKPDQTKEVNPSTNEQIITADTGYELSQVKVNGVTSEIDENIISENIKEGVTILGVQGNFVGSGDPVLEASYRSLLDNTLGANTTKLPSDLTSVGNYAFAYRTNLEITELPDTVSYIGQYAFRDCVNMALNKLPSNLTKIGSRAFYFCYKNSFNKIPDTVSEIGVYAFGSNTSLERILYSNKCGIIPEGCFNGCSNLKYFECEEQVYAIDYGSFKTSGLETLVIKRTTPPSLNASSLQNTPIASGNGYIYVPDEAINTYKSATNWSTYASQIKGISYLNPETAPSLLLLHAEDFTDSSINNLTVNNNNVSIVDGGKFGKCFYNDNTNYVETTLPNALGSRFTIDFWIKLNAYPTISEKFAVPFSIGEYNDGVYFQLETSTTSKTLYVWLGNKNKSIDANKIPLNTWTHLAVTFDGKKYDFYLNGERQFELENTVHTSQVNLNLFRSGGNVTLGRHFKGYIDEVKIVEVVRWTDNFTPPAEPYS